MTSAALIYPHQLFRDHPALAGTAMVVFVEDPLFFRQYRFHRQKLMLHRASMKSYAASLADSGHNVRYIDARQLQSSQSIGEHLKRWKVRQVRMVDPCDDWLSRRVTRGLKAVGIALDWLEDPHFLTPISEINAYCQGKKKLFFTDFYTRQRKRLDLLLEDGKPAGGKWSFDPENRKKLPRHVEPPRLDLPRETNEVVAARKYVREHFPGAVGDDSIFRYPIDHESATAWLKQFVESRLGQFGDFEDAISTRHEVLFHSVLTPMLNIGLISPQQVVDQALKQVNKVPINSLEGFTRQVIGWREFIRLVYLTHGRTQRTTNSWQFHHPMPAGLYDGSTGIEPVDHVIRQVLRTGYCHHIERLMILGNFMLLCEIDPDEVYRWFMELFIDAYDWVMVPNVYGMSQHADAGFMTTKPYISGSSYVLKMSDFKKGPWCPIWDALYWRFVDRQQAFFAGNPRMSMMVKLKDKLGPKLQEHHCIAQAYLDRLHTR